MTRLALLSLALAAAFASPVLAADVPCNLLGTDQGGTPVIILGSNNPEAPLCTEDQFAKYLPDEYAWVPRRDNIYRPREEPMMPQEPNFIVETYAPPLGNAPDPMEIIGGSKRTDSHAFSPTPSAIQSELGEDAL